MLGMSLVPRIGIKWTRATSEDVLKDEPDAKMKPMHHAYFGTGTRLVALVLTGTTVALIGQLSLEISILGDKVLGFYMVSLIKAALVPLLTVSPMWLW